MTVDRPSIENQQLGAAQRERALAAERNAQDSKITFMGVVTGIVRSTYGRWEVEVGQSGMEEFGNRDSLRQLETLRFMMPPRKLVVGQKVSIEITPQFYDLGDDT